MSHILLKIVGTANGLSLPSNNGISLDLASTSNTGALASADWNTFNGKISLASALTGFVLGADGTALAATDTILAAYQKLQVQSDAKAPAASPTFTGTATFNGPISLAASQGVTIATGAPGVTTNKLYQVSGNLYFNGVQLAAGGINLSSPITGYVLGSDATMLAATDTVLQAFQKLQFQMMGAMVNAPAYSGTMTLDCGTYDAVRVALTGALTMNMLTTGVQDGHRVLVELAQDATGTRIVTLGTGIAYGTDITSFTATTTPSKTDVLGFVFNAAAAKYRLIAVAKGY